MKRTEEKTMGTAKNAAAVFAAALISLVAFTFPACTQPGQGDTADGAGKAGMTQAEIEAQEKTEDATTIAESIASSSDFKVKARPGHAMPVDEKASVGGDVTLEFEWAGEGEPGKEAFAAFSDGVAEKARAKFVDAPSVTVFLNMPGQSSFSLRVYAQGAEGFGCVFEKWGPGEKASKPSAKSSKAESMGSKAEGEESNESDENENA